MKTCMFTGHYSQNAPFVFDINNKRCNELKRHLDFLIREKVRNGITHFISGLTSESVFYTAEIVLYMREEYPDITLDAILPYSNQSRKWNNKQIIKYNEILKRCNNVFVLKDTFSPYCIQKLNQYLVEHSDCALAIWNGTNRGASKTIKYALSKKLPVTVIHPFTFSVQNL